MVPRFCLPSLLHLPAACKSSHPFHYPNPSCLIHTHAICIYWSTSKGLFASRFPQISVQGSSFPLRFLGPSASSSTIFLRPFTQRDHTCLCSVVHFPSTTKGSFSRIITIHHPIALDSRTLHACFPISIKQQPVLSKSDPLTSFLLSFPLGTIRGFDETVLSTAPTPMCSFH